MTPDRTLTDEELAEMANEVHNAIWAGRDDTIACEGQEALDALIAALRASRAEIERMKIAARCDLTTITATNYRVDL